MVQLFRKPLCHLTILFCAVFSYAQSDSSIILFNNNSRQTVHLIDSVSFFGNETEFSISRGSKKTSVSKTGIKYVVYRKMICYRFEGTTPVPLPRYPIHQSGTIDGVYFSYGEYRSNLPVQYFDSHVLKMQESLNGTAYYDYEYSDNSGEFYKWPLSGMSIFGCSSKGKFYVFRGNVFSEFHPHSTMSWFVGARHENQSGYVVPIIIPGVMVGAAFGRDQPSRTTPDDEGLFYIDSLGMTMRLYRSRVNALVKQDSQALAVLKKSRRNPISAFQKYLSGTDSLYKDAWQPSIW